MKAALCVRCADLVAPHRDWETNRAWRWCGCGATGCRWRDGTTGVVEITSTTGPDEVRVLGLNNQFLQMAVRGNPLTGWVAGDAGDWRTLHHVTTNDVHPRYLFHRTQRDCWALLLQVGDTGDVVFVDYTPTMRTDP